MSPNNLNEMNNLSAILFPNSYLPESFAETIQSIFGRITICQPWFMDGPMPKAKSEGFSSIRIVRPAESLKPEGHFKRLLSEYRLWMAQNRDRGYTAFLNAIREAGLSEDNPWEIRQMIRQTGKESPVSQEDNSLKWHLILHLAREFEENRLEEEEMLSRVKHQKSPLAQALGDGVPAKGMFEDLPQSEKSLFVDKHHLGQVIKAWFGLFGGHLQDHALLITLDRHVMEYVTDIFEGETGHPPEEEEDSFSPESASSRIPFPRKYLPRLSDEKTDQTDPVLTHLSGKTIILLND
jgi:hypothetical protein